MADRFELAHIAQVTPGLWTGDPLEVGIEYQIKCTGSMCFTGWDTEITAVADGHSLKRAIFFTSIGNWNDRNTSGTLKFYGTMPPHDITIHLTVACRVSWGAIQIIKEDVFLPNLDEFPPPEDGIPPAYCTEGETRCEGKDLMVCSNSKWIVKEKNSYSCGYVPEECFEGTTRCVGTTLQRCVDGRWKTTKTNVLECGYAPPTPPDDGDLPPTPPDDKAKKFWDEYKWWIIGGIAIIAVAVLIIFPPKGIHLPRRGK